MVGGLHGRGIELCQTTKVFEGPPRKKPLSAVDHLSLSVPLGETFGLLGENGAGKTTAIQLILGLLKPTSGTVRVLEREPGDVEVNRSIGYLPETPRFHKFLSGKEFLVFHAELYGMEKSRIGPAVDRWLHYFALEQDSKRKIGTYSRGMLQRIGLAQALLPSPKILMLDEPTSGLDPSAVKLLRDTVVDQKREGASVFISSHNLSEVERVCDRVGFMKRGRLEQLVDLRAPDAEFVQTEMILRDVTPSLRSALFEHAGVSVEQSGDSVRVVIKGEDESKVNDLIDVVRLRKGVIRSVTPRRMSLEQLFLEYVSER